MRPPPNREKQVWTAVGAAALCGIALLVWQLLGGLGVALLGILMLFKAVRVELEGDRPVGIQSTPEFYARYFRAERDRNDAEHASGKAAALAVVSIARLFAVAGALLAIAGCGLIFLGYGPPETRRCFGYSAPSPRCRF